MLLPALATYIESRTKRLTVHGTIRRWVCLDVKTDSSLMTSDEPVTAGGNSIMSVMAYQQQGETAGLNSA